jgi:putative oxidoreductase
VDTVHEIGRILICGFFLVMVVKNILSWQENVGMVGQVLPFPELAIAVGMVLEVLGAVLVLFHLQVVVGATLLAIFTIAATALFLRFWTVGAPVERHFITLLFCNNFAILGGVLLLM